MCASRGEKLNADSLMASSGEIVTRMLEMSGGDIGEATRRMAALQQALAGRTFTIQSELMRAEEDAIALIQSQEFPPRNEFEEANHIVFQARQAKGRQRTKLARDAIARSPDCAAAYLLLGDEATTPQQAQKFYEQAIAAAERVLGTEWIEENAGRLSAFMEASTYLQARCSLAEELWDQGQPTAAIAHLEDVLRLDAGDVLEVRYGLGAWLIATMDLQGLERIIKKFSSDDSPAWLYTSAIYAFLKTGPTEASEEALRKAMTASPLVMVYLFGGRRPVVDESPALGLDQEDEEAEATLIATTMGEEWVRNTLVLEWILTVLARTLIRPVVMPPPVSIGRASAKRGKALASPTPPAGHAKRRPG